MDQAKRQLSSEEIIKALYPIVLAAAGQRRVKTTELLEEFEGHCATLEARHGDHLKLFGLRDDFRRAIGLEEPQKHVDHLAGAQGNLAALEMVLSQMRRDNSQKW